MDTITGRIALGVAGLLILVVMLGAAAASGVLAAVGLGQTNQPGPSSLASRDIPADYQALYVAAATTCPGLPWTVLAAVGKVETNHGRSPLPGVHTGTNPAGAAGEMQFEPATFTQYAVDADGGGADPYDPADAIFSAAKMLCADGARDATDIAGALLAYNHDPAYVAHVLAVAASYAATTPTSRCPAPTTTRPGSDQQPASAGLTAVAFACGQLGTPYVWGGTGDPGFDCSGLTLAAYATAGITLPRTAQAQYDTSPAVPAGVPLQPGDLVFFGTRPADVSHVGIALAVDDGGRAVMVDAPHLGAVVRVEPFPTALGAAWGQDIYLGATRPSDR